MSCYWPRNCISLLLLSARALTPTAAVTDAETRHHDAAKNKNKTPPRLILPSAVNESYSSNNNDTVLLVTLTKANFDFTFRPTPSQDANEFVRVAASRVHRAIFSALPDYPEDASLYYCPAVSSSIRRVPLLTLDVQVESVNMTLQHGVDESYELRVDRPLSDHTTPSSRTDATATIHSKTVFGALRALETFSQLVEFGWTETQEHSDSMMGHDDVHVFVIHNTPLSIQDRPYYPFRGLLIDTARHYLPVSLILDNLDAMSHSKLNVLHWHLTDSQSFPLVSRVYPELSREGAFSPHHVYTPDDIQRVIYEAYLRGIRVIPEVDTPGHVAALGKSHMELLTSCEDQDDRVSERPLDPTRPQLYSFLEPLFRELSEVFLDDMIHMGGDEVGVDCWKASKDIQKWIREHGLHDEKDVYEFYETNVLNMITCACGKQPIVWQEVFQSVRNLSASVIIDVWKGLDVDTMQKATLQNRSVVLSGCWYLDHLDQDWKDFYNCKPWDFNGTLHQQSLVIGGKACMWGESVDASNFMSRVWPRASAVAERLWTGPSGAGEKSIDRRMRAFRCYLLRHGVLAQPVGTGICDKEPKYGRLRRADDSGVTEF